jgi:hypothetical protein
MPRLLHNGHLNVLRSYVADGELGYHGRFPYVREVMDLAERMAPVVAGGPPDTDMALFTPRDVELLTRTGRALLETAGSPAVTSHARLSMGQSMLDVRDAMETALIAVGKMPERRERTR